MRGQCEISAAKATFRALGAVSDGDEARIAFPDNANDRRVLGPVLPALASRSAIIVYLVSEADEVRELHPAPR